MSEETKKWRRGDVREDGMVFWGRYKSYLNGEYWVTQEKYREKDEKAKERRRTRYHSNADSEREKRKAYEKSNPEKTRERWKRYQKANPDKTKEQSRRSKLRKSLRKYDGSSYETWIDSLTHPMRTITAIFQLQLDEGQTLAELIHELSGYPMTTCEKIANPEP